MNLRAIRRLCAIAAAVMTVAAPVSAQDGVSSAPPPPSTPSSPPHTVILFDQSGSMGRFDALAISTIWIKTLAKTFGRAQSVSLVGFDSILHPPLRIRIDPGANMQAAVKRLAQISMRGKTTDMEAPFRYLAELSEPGSVDLALIISDGEPEIWDAKTGYMSLNALNDPRYADLNARYREMYARNVAESEILAKLGPEYHRRNLRLIEERLASIAPAIAKKTVIWDISAHSAHLRAWSQKLGAEYTPVNVSEQELSIAQLLQALLNLQAKTSDLVNEPLREDAQKRFDTVVQVVRETARELHIADLPPAPPDLPSIPEKTAFAAPPAQVAAPSVEQQPAPAAQATPPEPSPTRMETPEHGGPEHGEIASASVPASSVLPFSVAILVLGSILLAGSVSWQLRRGMVNT